MHSLQYSVWDVTAHLCMFVLVMLMVIVAVVAWEDRSILEMK